MKIKVEVSTGEQENLVLGAVKLEKDRDILRL